MVDTLSDDKFTASSCFNTIYNTGFTADKARLSSTGWSPDHTDTIPWIQVFVR